MPLDPSFHTIPDGASIFFWPSPKQRAGANHPFPPRRIGTSLNAISSGVLVLHKIFSTVSSIMVCPVEPIHKLLCCMSLPPSKCKWSQEGEGWQLCMVTIPYDFFVPKVIWGLSIIILSSLSIPAFLFWRWRDLDRFYSGVRHRHHLQGRIVHTSQLTSWAFFPLW